jgi:hypothetical protein
MHVYASTRSLWIDNTEVHHSGQLVSGFRISEKGIDRVVYALYGLTQDEIKIVEGEGR